MDDVPVVGWLSVFDDGTEPLVLASGLQGLELVEQTQVAGHDWWESRPVLKPMTENDHRLDPVTWHASILARQTARWRHKCRAQAHRGGTSLVTERDHQAFVESAALHSPVLRYRAAGPDGRSVVTAGASSRKLPSLE